MIKIPKWALRAAYVGFLAFVGCDPPPVGPEPFQGVIEFEEHVLAFEVPGLVRSISVEEGDEVEVGSEVARLDDTIQKLERETMVAQATAVRAELKLLNAGSTQAELRSLKAELRAARSSEKHSKRVAERERRLTTSGIGTAAVLDAAETRFAESAARRQNLEHRLKRMRDGARDEEVEAAEARAQAAETAVRGADERIARHVLHSSVGGMVLDVHSELGEFAGIGTPVASVANVRRPYVDVFVPQAQIGGVKLGDEASVRVDSQGAAFTGKVEHISRQTEFTPKFLFSERERPNLVIRVRVRIDDPGADLHAGVPAFVMIAGKGVGGTAS